MWSSTSFLMSASSSLSTSDASSPLHSIAQYIEDYIDLVENVPNDIARQITQLHEHNHRYHQLLGQLETTLDVASGKTTATEARRRTAMLKIQRFLIEIQEIADDKLVLIQSILDQLDTKARQLEYDYRAVNLLGSTSVLNSRLTQSQAASQLASLSQAKSQDQDQASPASGSASAPPVGEQKETGSAGHQSPAANNGTANQTGQAGHGHGHGKGHGRAARRGQGSGRGEHEGGKRSVKRGVKGASARDLKKNKHHSLASHHQASSPTQPMFEGAPIDPDEPTYCICEQVSFGEMICCDNSACPIEWFHFSCVALNTKPKGKWFCPNCRGERSNIPKK